MTVAKDKREQNHREAFALLLTALGDRAIDTTLFAPEGPLFESVLRTTWEELLRDGYIERVATKLRLTAKGWLLATEATELSDSKTYKERLGRLLAAMKGHVRGRKDSAVVELQKLARESGEAEGWIFNVIDSRAGSAIGNERTGAQWYGNERGRLVEIPVNFNLEPIDISSALTVKHLEKIEELERKIEEISEDRAQFHCPHCDTEDSPCLFGPNWPKEDDFDFECVQRGAIWECFGRGKTRDAKRIRAPFGTGKAKEDVEYVAKKGLHPRRPGHD